MKIEPVFIIEDDVLYRKALKAFLLNTFPDIRDVKMFPVGEMAVRELNTNPGMIIIDYFLNSKVSGADNGLEIIKQIRVQKPKIKMIVLSGQDSPGVILEAIRDYDCVYVQKDKDAFSHIERLIKQFLAPKNHSPVVADVKGF